MNDLYSNVLDDKIYLQLCQVSGYTTNFTEHPTMRGPSHDDVIKWKHFPRYWPFVRGIHRWPANSPHTDQWRGTLMFSLICAWIHAWVNNHEAGDLRRHRAQYDVIIIEGNANWEPRVIMPTELSLVTPEFAVMATSGATNDDKVGIMPISLFQCMPWRYGYLSGFRSSNLTFR